MTFKYTLMMAAAPIAAFASPAAAQGIPVFDSSSYLQALATVQHTATMIQQGEQQIRTATTALNSLQKLTDINRVATSLLQPQIRNILPDETIDAATLVGGDLTRIGIARDHRSQHPVALRAKADGLVGRGRRV
ncbi:type IV secretion system protein [Sphingomonas aliaeris]|uniref:type IV secretion system protein n=1 Tax=Sphingomonas aliaeris TaxID=2759526 RepID=UPI0021F1E1E4|nr:type IV secretion system protein [Sphingomonas aliaeris]